MRLPFVHSGVVDVIVEALKAGGFITDDASANAIRTAPAQMTEAERNAIAVGLAYGGGGGGGGGGGAAEDLLSGKQNVWILVDSDGTDVDPAYTNYLHVGKGQSGTPVLDPYRMLYSVGSPSPNVPDMYVTMNIGPHADQIVAPTYVGGRINIGRGGTNTITSALPYMDIYATRDAAAIRALGLDVLQLTIRQNYIVNIDANKRVLFRSASNDIRGGFVNLDTTSRFGVGADLFGSPSAHAIAIEKLSDDTLRIRSTDTSTERTIYVMGSHPTVSADDKRVRFCIGGVPGQAGQDPANAIVIGGGYMGVPGSIESHTISTLIVSPDRGSSTRSSAFQVWHKTSNVPNNTHLVNFNSNINMHSVSNTVRLLSVTAWRDPGTGTSSRTIAFEVRADGTTYSHAFSSAGIDIAETFACLENSEHYGIGTVMVQQDGTVHTSAVYCDPRVVGIVSTEPGLLLGDRGAGADNSGVVKLAMTGTVPVNCTTAYGSIEIGDLLVSSEGGLAAKSPDTVPPGCVVGKALEALVQPDSTPVTGTIKMLVLNR